MRNKLALFIALAFLPFLVHSDGFPSRPTFQHVTIRNGALSLNGTTQQKITGQALGSGTAAVSYFAWSDSGGTRKGYVGDADAGDSDISLVAETASANINLQTSSGLVVSNSTMGVTASAPALRLFASGAATDRKDTRIESTSSGQFQLNAYSDAGALMNTLIIASRAGGGFTTTTFGQTNGAVTLTGSTLTLAATTTTNVTGTDLQLNGVSVATSSGTMTPTLTTGCTTTPTVNFRWARAGNVVTLAQTNTPTCTSNAVTTAITAALPASIRPAVNQCVAYIAATDNGAGTVAAVEVQTDGDLNWGEGAGAACSALGWTASGTKTLNAFSGSYVLN